MNVQNSNTNLQNFIDIVLELDPNKILFAPSLDGVIEFEKWKDIPNYEGYYQISSFGRVKSLKRMVKRADHYVQIKLRIIKLIKESNGYLSVGLVNDVKRKGFQTHLLVAMAFLKHKPDGFKIVVDHKDNNPINNRLCNLQLISNRENSTKDRKTGTSKYTGVSWKSSRNKWKSVIYHNGKETHLGFFDDELEASNYYQEALKSIENGTEIKIKRKTNTSKYKGVYKKGSGFASQNGKKYLGTFPTEEEAYQALLIAQKE